MFAPLALVPDLGPGMPLAEPQASLKRNRQSFRHVLTARPLWRCGHPSIQGWGLHGGPKLEKFVSEALAAEAGDVYHQRTTLRVGNQLGTCIASLIVPNTRYGPSGAMSTPQYKDGTSMAAPDSENTSRRLSGSQLPGGDVHHQPTLRVGNRSVSRA